MYQSRKRDKSGLFRRLFAWISASAVSFRERSRVPHAVAAYQRAWQFKKMGRSGALCLLFAALIGAGGWVTYTIIYNSDIFRLTKVVIQGNTMTRSRQILDQSGLKIGVSLFGLDTVHAEQRVESLPWVDQARIQRNWSTSLTIKVREHRPLALINVNHGGGKHLCYVNDKGRVFAPRSVAADLDFPVLTGPLVTEDLKDMRVRRDSLTGKALDFLKLATGGNQILPVQTISEIHVHPEDGLIIYLVDHPFPIYMGKEHIRTRYFQLVKVLDRLYRQDTIKEISEIRMDYAKNRILVAKLESL